MARFVVDITPLRRYRHFRRLWAGQVVSGLGSQLTLVAVSFQAYALTRSTLVVGSIGLAQLVPLLAGALWGGTLADATPAGIVTAWMHSPPHREIILTAAFRDAGAGVVPAVPSVIAPGAPGATYAIEFGVRG